MDLCCKCGVDYSLCARDIAVIICAILKTNIPKTAIFSWELCELKCFRIHGPLHVRVHRVAFSRGSHAFKMSTYC